MMPLASLVREGVGAFVPLHQTVLELKLISVKKLLFLSDFTTESEAPSFTPNKMVPSMLRVKVGASVYSLSIEYLHHDLPCPCFPYPACRVVDATANTLLLCIDHHLHY